MMTFYQVQKLAADQRRRHEKLMTELAALKEVRES